jgi:hypothetical protein
VKLSIILLSSAKVKNMWGCTSTLQTYSWVILKTGTAMHFTFLYLGIYTRFDKNVNIAL